MPLIIRSSLSLLLSHGRWSAVNSLGRRGLPNPIYESLGKKIAFYLFAGITQCEEDFKADPKCNLFAGFSETSTQSGRNNQRRAVHRRDTDQIILHFEDSGVLLIGVVFIAELRNPE
jgi:hypothetical protein